MDGLRAQCGAACGQLGVAADVSATRDAAVAMESVGLRAVSATLSDRKVIQQTLLAIAVDHTAFVAASRPSSHRRHVRPAHGQAGMCSRNRLHSWTLCVAVSLQNRGTSVSNLRTGSNQPTQSEDHEERRCGIRDGQW